MDLQDAHLAGHQPARKQSCKVRAAVLQFRIIDEGQDRGSVPW